MSTKFAAVITIALGFRVQCRSHTVCGKSSVSLLERKRKILCVCFFTKSAYFPNGD